MGNEVSGVPHADMPRWIPDDHHDSCQECTAQFTATLRRHHCRACGRLFCDDCSQDRRVLAWYLPYDTEQRVCQNCAEEQNYMNDFKDGLPVKLEDLVLNLEVSFNKNTQMHPEKFESNLSEMEELIDFLHDDLFPNMAVFTHLELYEKSLVALRTKYQIIQDAFHTVFKVHRLADDVSGHGDSSKSIILKDGYSEMVMASKIMFDEFESSIPVWLKGFVCPVSRDFDIDWRTFATRMIEARKARPHQDDEDSDDMLDWTMDSVVVLDEDFDTTMSLSFSYDTMKRDPVSEDFAMMFANANHTFKVNQALMTQSPLVSFDDGMEDDGVDMEPDLTVSM